MFKKSCRCGASEKNFKMDIGAFFIGECCELAGYDAFGQKTKEALSNEEIAAMAQDLAGADDLMIKDEPQVDAAPEDESEEVVSSAQEPESQVPVQTEPQNAQELKPEEVKEAKIPRLPRANKDK